jgi:tape measure domain-containing protein
VAYRADIEIAVKGAQELKRLQNEIRLSVDAVNSLNSSFAGVANLIPRSINNLNSIVAEAAANFNKVALGTEEATIAARAYVSATNELNSGLRERLRLVRSIEAAETAAGRTIRPSEAGYGQQTPALPPALVRAKEIQQNWAAFFRDASEVATDLRSIKAATSLNLKQSWGTFFTEAALLGDELKTTATAKALNLKQSWGTFFTEAALLGDELKTTATAKALNLKQSWNTFFTEAASLGDELKTTTAAKALNLKQSWNTFFTEAAELAADLAASTQRTAAAIRQREGAASGLARQRLADEAARREERAAFLTGTSAGFPFGPNPRSRRFRFEGDVSPERAEAALAARELEQQRKANQQLFAEERQQIIALDRFRADAAQKQTQRVQALAKTIRGSLSSAAIGGAFPLLFGQSPQAAVGGAIGGLLGGQAGGFAGSLIGTALGELEAAKARVKELTLELGLSAAQGKVLSDAFELAGRNSEQLEAAITNIQGLGLSTSETSSALKIAVELSREYGGSVEKIAQAFADTLESGKVSVSTLNKFTAQGIPIQDTLAAKLGVSRTKLLEMAKDGAISVQQVTDVLVKMGQEAEKTANKGETGFDRFTKAVANIASAIAGAAGAILRNLVPALDTVLTKLANIITQATRAINLISDATVGELSSAVFGAGFARGTGFANRGTVDAITKALANLKPEIATTREELKKIEVAAGSAQLELSKYGGALGEYSLGTAQVQLSRVQRGIIQRRQALGRPAGPASIQQITAPANLPPSAGGSKAKGKSDADKLAEELQRSLEEGRKLSVEFSRQIMLNSGLSDVEKKRLQIVFDYQDYQKQISNLKNAEQRKTLELLNIDFKRQKNRELDLEITKESLKTFEKLAGLDFSNTENLGIRAFNRGAGGGNFRTDISFDPLNKTMQKQDEMRAKLKELTDPINAATTGAQAISGAFGSAFQSIISGAQSTEEALAGVFKNIGESFINMATEILAQMMMMFIFKQLLGLFGGGGGGGGGGLFSGAGPVAFPGGGGFAKGFLMEGPGFTSFAEGGFVAGPTQAVVGEGGESEYIIPASKMRSAMSRYAAGARGSAVIPAGDDTSSGGGTATMAPAAIDVRYTVERINSVDYVTADQFRAGMAQAAQQGATQGEQRTLRRLQQSRATRSRLGMN